MTTRTEILASCMLDKLQKTLFAFHTTLIPFNILSLLCIHTVLNMLCPGNFLVFSIWCFMCFWYVYGFVFLLFGEIFFYSFVEDLVYAMTLDSSPLPLSIISKAWFFMVSHISCMFLSYVFKKVFMFLAYLVQIIYLKDLLSCLHLDSFYL